MNTSHELILLAGSLGLVSIVVGAMSARLQAPLLLVFLLLGMLAGEDGPGGIAFNDFHASYLIGSIALAVILFEGGLKTHRATIRLAIAPSLALATIGITLTAGIVATAAVWLFSLSWPQALLIGAVLAPTDAAAVNHMLRSAAIAAPERVTAALELESGLNDPMSVFLTALLVEGLTSSSSPTAGHALLLLLEEMGGGALAGIIGGNLLLWLLRRLPVQISLYPVLALSAVLFVFGAAQTLGASGFLAVYLVGIVVGTKGFEKLPALTYAAETFAWLAQVILFLMLGLLVAPHELIPFIGPILAIAMVLLFLGRPLGCFACLLPFGYSAREAAFVSWAGLRGAAPIYLAIIPVLAGLNEGPSFFGAVFGVVIASLALQGWTFAPAARLLGFARRSGAQTDPLK
ncbi:MAG: potassium/proton antiporter [Acidobacteriota bacterium]|nr:potassium/proton antiporter [Acidobacteriota bacterium]